MTASFFSVPGALSFVIEDHSGPVMFVRVDIQGYDARMHIQFDEGQRRRTAVALVKGFPIVRDILKKQNVRVIIFDSVSPSLTAFCQKHLGFTRLSSKDDHYIAIL